MNTFKQLEIMFQINENKEFDKSSCLASLRDQFIDFMDDNNISFKNIEAKIEILFFNITIEKDNFKDTELDKIIKFTDSIKNENITMACIIV